MSPEFIQPDFFNILDDQNSSQKDNQENSATNEQIDETADRQILADSGIQINDDEFEKNISDDPKQKIEDAKILADSGIEIVDIEEADLTPKVEKINYVVANTKKPTIADGFTPGAPSKWDDIKDDEEKGTDKPWWQND